MTTITVVTNVGTKLPYVGSNHGLCFTYFPYKIKVQTFTEKVGPKETDTFGG